MINKKFTQEELRYILILIELKLDKLDEDALTWKDLEDAIPDFILEDSAKYSQLRDKVLSLMS